MWVESSAPLHRGRCVKNDHEFSLKLPYVTRTAAIFLVVNALSSPFSLCFAGASMSAQNSAGNQLSAIAHPPLRRQRFVKELVSYMALNKLLTFDNDST